ncbi:unnamed protein product, partial [Mesorhabditis belari]|uniref:BTB domain-containing protein n=1 Tax=Mesorhabditis belari TaxID=2138241 RepID=A0AAF3EF60_9BILA
MNSSMTSTTSVGEERVTFRHNFNFEISPTGHRLSFIDRRETSFVTIHGMAIYEWMIAWGPEQAFNWRRNLSRKSILELTIPSFTLSDRLPHPIEATFHLSIHDEDDNEVCPLVSQTVLPQNVDSDPKFRLDSDSLIVSRILWARDQLARLNGINRRWTCYLCTMLQLEASDFALSTNWGNPAPPPPNPLDFRFGSIVDRSRHDITIVCLNGRVSASKEALFHASTYFRGKLLRPEASLEIYEHATRLVVEELITYMLTETYAHEGPMSTRHADELLQLIERYHPIKKGSLVTSIEQHLLVQVDQKRTDLPFLLRCFLLALKNGLDRLAVAVGAIVYELHFNDYMLDYGAATELNRRNHPLINDLQSRGGLFRPSAHIKLTSLHPLTRDVQIISKEL